ncbi:ATP synthase subunit I [Desulfohalovibrio reitneri]|uniref:ATP synthase subunit I n=1 Tax=Desulfohalovibrio reitneri TaxID=1307759 RepID=UPI0004A6BBC8|nr:ATP synthase subunit I [Desulfohalovibrio reitneri]
MNGGLYLDMTLGLLGGVVIGAACFAALWWQIGRVRASSRPGLYLLLGFVVRSVVAVGGLWLISGGRPLPLLTGVLGFFLARLAATRLVRPRGTEEA